MVEKLQEWASQRGYRVAWGSGMAVSTVRREIAGRSESEIDGRFFDDELKSIVAEGLENPEHTIVLVAKPSAAHLIHFDVEGKSTEVLLPPTYFRYRASFEEIRRDLADNVFKEASPIIIPEVSMKYTTRSCFMVLNCVGSRRLSDIQRAEWRPGFLQHLPPQNG